MTSHNLNLLQVVKDAPRAFKDLSALIRELQTNEGSAAGFEVPPLIIESWGRCLHSLEQDASCHAQVESVAQTACERLVASFASFCSQAGLLKALEGIMFSGIEIAEVERLHKRISNIERLALRPSLDTTLELKELFLVVWWAVRKHRPVLVNAA